MVKGRARGISTDGQRKGKDSCSERKVRDIYILPKERPERQQGETLVEINGIATAKGKARGISRQGQSEGQRDSYSWPMERPDGWIQKGKGKGRRIATTKGEAREIASDNEAEC